MSYNPVNPNGQATMVNSEPVVIASNQTAIPVTVAALTDKTTFVKLTDGTDTALVTASGEQNVLESNSAAIKTAVELIDNAIDGVGFNISKINGEAVDVGAGTEAAAFRVTLPTDGTGKVGLNAGTNAIGKLAANSGIDIGDVDVTSIIPGTGATNLGKAEDSAHTSADVGVFNLSIRNEAGATFADTNLDYSGNAVDRMGQIYLNPDNLRLVYRGRTGTFRSPGIAGTAGQKLLAIHNATGSSTTVRIKRIIIDMYATVVKAVTVAPPVVRVWRFTAVPTNGNALTKSKIGGGGATDSNVTVWQGASADGTSSGTALTISLPAGAIVDQAFPERIITAAGSAGIKSPLIFEYPNGIDLPALTGISVFLDYATATFNPITDMWVASIEWEEFLT